MTDADLLALFLNLYPDNNSREISEEDLRQGLESFLTTVSARIGELDDLETPLKTSLVAAINSLQTQVDDLSLISVKFGPDDPNIVPPAEFGIGTFYMRLENIGGTIQPSTLYLYTGISGIGWFKLVDKNGFLEGIQKVSKTAGTAFDLPALKKNQSVSYRFMQIGTSVGGVATASGWLGGASGILISNNTWVIAMEDSPGGDWFTHGNKYLIVNNQVENPSVQAYATFGDFPIEGELNIIYLALDTSIMYYWDQESEAYEVLGNAIYGTYINPTTFNDTLGDPVIPSGSQLYIDTTTNKIYRWDGNNFVLMAGGSGSGIQSIVAGDNITIDNTDPLNPIISSIGSGDIEWSQTDW